MAGKTPKEKIEETVLQQQEQLDKEREEQERKLAEAKKEGQQAAQVAPKVGLANVNGADIVTRSGSVGTSESNSTQQSLSRSQSQSQNSSKGKSVSYTERDPELRNELEKEADEVVMKGYGWVKDENGEWVRDPNSTLYNALKIDREKDRAERERQIEINKKKGLASALSESAKLVSDMIFGGIGGNVYERKPDTIASDAAKENQRLRELQAAQDVAFRNKELQELNAALKEKQQYVDAQTDKYAKKLTETEQSGEQNSTQFNEGVTNSSSATTTRQSSNQGTWYSDRYLANHHSSGWTIDGNGNLTFTGGGGSGMDKVDVTITDSTGKTVKELKIPTKDKKELIGHAKRLLQADMNSGKISSSSLKGIYTPPGLKNKTEKWNDDKVLSQSVITRYPDLLNKYMDLMMAQGYSINGDRATRTDIYQAITGINPRTENGRIDPNKVLDGVVLDGVAGTASSINQSAPTTKDNGSAGMFD